MRGPSIRVAWPAALGTLVCILWSSIAGADGEPAVAAARELSAPPSDITAGIVAPPVPTTLRSRSAMLRPDRDGAVVVDLVAGRRASIAIVAAPSASRDGVVVEIIAPDGSRLVDATSESPRLRRAQGDIGSLFGIESWPAERFDFVPATTGAWTVQRVRADGTPDPAWVAIVADGAATELTARWTSLQLVAGRPAALAVAWGDGSAPAPESIEADVTAPGGASIPASFAAGVLRFVPAEPGPHLVSITAKGTAVRSMGVLAAIAEPARLLLVSREASADGLREPWNVAVEGDHEALLVAAEVWAVSGEIETPICWVASLSPVVDRGNGRMAQAMFDRRWLQVAGVAEGTPLELRRVRLHDRSTWTPIDQLDRLAIGPAVGVPSGAPIDIAEMTRGRPGGHGVPLSLESTPSQDDAMAGAHALLIVHGYCSGGVTFPPSHFSGEVGVFLDPNQAKSNDAFAQTLLLQSSQFKSFGVAAHSQGGLASLHLHAFYWSGLDWAGPGLAGNSRLIQSVGSPYQGTPLAGNLAVLGQIFGSGCGAVSDMTPDGAAAWLSTIPTWARADVWYWTTSFEDGPFFDYCNLITDLFLTDPDDGVIEKFRGQLPGANSMGHVEGWCHTTGMADPPQYNDAVRNAQINAQAAR